MQLNFMDVSYIHPDGENLFNGLNFTLSKKVTALVGNNGSGKTTIFKLLNNEIYPASGKIFKTGEIYALPQNLDLYAENTLQEVLGVDKKLSALRRITEGISKIEDFEILDNNWNIENEVETVIKNINLSLNDLDRKIKTFSGGEVSKIFFSSLATRKPDLALLDEPTNNLDRNSREFLYKFIKDYKGNIFVISHDIELLLLADEIIEIHNGSSKTYGGNYEFYKAEREREKTSLEKQFSKNILEKKNLETQLQKKNEASRRNQIRGKKNAVMTGLPKMAANARKQNAENTAAAKSKNGENKISKKSEDISELKEKLYQDRIVKIDFENKVFAKNKLLIKTEKFNPNFGYDLWQETLDFEVFSQDRLLISGNNGCGKTTLIQAICKEHSNYSGSIYNSTNDIKVLNQNFLHLDEDLTLLEIVKNSAIRNISEHEIRIKLGRFLFYGEDAFKKVISLSGGEKVRLSLLKLLVNEIPDVLILDEPTNNLDLFGIEQLIDAANSYKGCLIVISHDLYFISRIAITKELKINKNNNHKIKFLLNNKS